MSQWNILHGDVRKHLKTLPSDHFDAVLSDPPYGISFLSNRWDYQLPSVNVWTELLRVVKPGAHVMLFGGPRTFHRLVCSVEDAGFIPRDLLMYLHAKGFPKSLDIAKAIDKAAGHWRGRAGKQKSVNAALGGPNLERTPKGEPSTEARLQWKGYGSALKPAYEPVLLAMKNLDGTFVENVQKWGTGALAIDACRVPPVGRWPANVAFDEEAVGMLDEMLGERKGMSGGGKHRADYPGGMFGGVDSEGTARGDSGGASRFFFTTKVSRGEREQGCDALTETETETGALSHYNPSKLKNTHPTLKAIELTRWLATLLLPPAQEGRVRRILVPFSGAGSEMIGCLQAGWDEVIGIDGEAKYIEIAKSRITKGGVFSGLLDKRMRKQASKR